MLIFTNKNSRSQYNRLRRFYRELIEKNRREITAVVMGNCYQTEQKERLKSYQKISKLTEEVRSYQEFIYLEEYAMNTDTDVEIFASKGDFTGFDVLFKKPVYNALGYEDGKKNWFNGGFINHGTIRKPQWSLHT